MYRAIIWVQILPVAPSPSCTMSDLYRDSIFWIEVERIKPNPYQPRRDFDESKLKELAESIRMYGLLQPLTVTKNETPRENGGIAVEYELIAGERRLRASKIAGLSQIPVIIRTGEQTDQMKLELAIIENIQREDLNPIDRAKAFIRLHSEFHFTHIQIGKKVGKSREYVSNSIRLLTLPESIIGYLAEGKITEGHARPLMMLRDKPDEQTVLAREIMLKKLTVRESESIARRSAQDRVSAKNRIHPEVLHLERSLTEKLGTRVTIEPREVGGRLVISYFSASDLEALLNAIEVERKEGVSTVFDGTSPVEDAPKQHVRDAATASAASTAEDQTQAGQGEPAVEPAPERPQPEPSEVGSRSIMEAALTSLGVQADEQVKAMVPAVHRDALEQDKDGEEDLYSLRNFSI